MNDLTKVERKRIQTLRRRRDHLRRMLTENTRRTDNHWIGAEATALDWAIQALTEGRGDDE